MSQYSRQNPTKNKNNPNKISNHTSNRTDQAFDDWALFLLDQYRKHLKAPEGEEETRQP